MGRLSAVRARLRRPVGTWAVVALWAWVCAVPAWLFADPLRGYYLWGDDWEYVAASRTWGRAFENLWTAHNVHVVPVWRVWSAAVVSTAGDLTNLPSSLAAASYLVLIGVMLLAGRLVARETKNEALALVTAAFLGTTSLMEQAGSWFSASQASGAGFGVLLTLWFVQGWRDRGGAWRLGMAVVSTWLAGGAWTTGHVAGPVAAVYLLADGRRRCVLAAAVPLVGTAVAVAVALGMGARGIDEQSTISFHGRKTEEAVSPLQGAFHTIQAIPERLVCGDLGLATETTLGQAVILVAGLAFFWAWTRRNRLWPNPMEAAGATLVVLPYWVLWTFRGYLPFSSLRGFVPWYETIPQIGAALFAAGWWSGARGAVAGGPAVPLTRLAAVGVVVFQLGLARLNEPRVQALFEDPLRIGFMNEKEKLQFPIPELRRFRAIYLWGDRADRQRRHFTRLDRAQVLARRKGVGRDVLAKVFGRVLWPNPPVIDDADLLDLPATSTGDADPDLVRSAFAPAFAAEPTTVVPWLDPTQPWPPR